MNKLFVYNFNGTIYETYEAFDETYRAMKKEAIANGEPFSRQVITNEKIFNEYYVDGCWLTESIERI